MNRRIINYTISDFVSSDSEVRPLQSIDDPILSGYVNRNEINQDLPNAPLNNQPDDFSSHYNSSPHIAAYNPDN